MDKKAYAKSMLEFLNAAPTPFQSIELLKDMLTKADAVELQENAVWNLEKGKLYYFEKDGSQLVAFRMGTENLADTGFRMSGAHHDYPGFRIKPAGSQIDGGIERIAVEPYGGMIVRGWFDRPLSVAGRLCVRSDKGIKTVNVNIHEPLLIIPSLANHLSREVNDAPKISMQNDVLPFFCFNDGNEKTFIKYIAQRAGVKHEDILSFDLTAYDYQEGCFIGPNEDFISTARLDDASMVHASFTALLEAQTPYTCIAVAYDHEEIGSNSTRGARSNSLMMTVDRIIEKLGLSVEDKYRALANSVMFSADMAHAVHPAYVSKMDPNHKLYLNKGPVLKTAQYQSYATSSRGSAIFTWLCENNNIPYQVFTNHSDARGGGTIGPIIASAHGITTVDIGNPMMSMHAIRELAGTDDQYYMTMLFKALFESDLKGAIC